MHSASEQVTDMFSIKYLQLDKNVNDLCINVGGFILLTVCVCVIRTPVPTPLGLF